ncbi:MAG: TIGR04372 family glycosyltransferase [Betaproteobacteria bacterium]
MVIPNTWRRLVAAYRRYVYPQHDQREIKTAASDSFALGLRATGIGDLESAMTHLSEAVRQQPDSPESYGALGNVLIGLGRLDDAISNYQRALTLDPDRAETRCNLARTLLAVERHDEAITEIERVLQCDRIDHPDLYNALGSAHHLSGRIREAVAAWSAGMEAQDRRATAGRLKRGTRYLAGPNWTTAIGHIALLDFFAKRKILGLSVDRYVILADMARVANAAYLDCWRDHFEIITDPAEIGKHADVRLLQDYPLVLSVASECHWLHDAMCLIEERWEASGRAPLVSLSHQQIEQGREALKRLDVPHDAWFVVLHVRDGGLYDGSKRIRRNAAISDYRPAIESITKAGGWVFRLGSGTAAKLPSMRNVIDYAHADIKADWLDVFLISQARFFLGTNSGPVWVAKTFGVPALLTNWAPIGIQSHVRNSLMLPQLMRSERDGRSLRFAEQMQAPLAHTESASVLQSLGVTVIPNTPVEIAEAVDEMLTLTSGDPSSRIQEEALQKRFDGHLLAAGIFGRGRISSTFLRRHAELV